MRKHGSPLLMELIIVVLFFVLASSVMMEVFTTANSVTVRTAAETEALREGQNLAERLYASEDGTQLLTGEGFQENNGYWEKEEDGLHISVTKTTQQTRVGSLLFYSVTVSAEGETLLTLPVTRFDQGEVRP